MAIVETEEVKVNLIPGMTLPVVHVSQYDTGGGRPLKFRVYNGTEKYEIPTNLAITFDGTKPDGTGFSFECTYEGSLITNSNYTKQATSIAGANYTQLSFTDENGDQIGSIGITLYVQKAGLADEEIRLSQNDIIALSDAQNQYRMLLAKINKNTNSIEALEVRLDDDEADIDTLIEKVNTLEVNLNEAIKNGSISGSSSTMDVYYYNGSNLLGTLEDQDVSLPVNLSPEFTPTVEDYTFYGWSTSADGEERLETGYIAPEGTKTLILYAMLLPTATTFSITGTIQSFAAKKGVTYRLEVYGAQGGSGVFAGNRGGYGGYAIGYYTPSINETLYVGVGGSTSGYNGGGSGIINSGGLEGGRNGGGATHIGKTSALLANTDKSNVLIVAGGGGGSASANFVTATGGNGGGISGSAGTTGLDPNGNYKTASAGGGGSQASGYAYGIGGNASHIDSGAVGGGGGGLYGGWGGYAGAYCAAAGGGGSGYIGGVTEGSMSNGQRSGDGEAVITVYSVA